MSKEALARRALELFDGALDLPESEWDAFLSRACDGWPELRREAENLLAAHARAEGMLDGASGAAEWMTDAAGPEPEAEGEKVGPYRLIKEIGRGGMGVVYLAHDTRLGRRIALKFLSAHLTSDTRGRERLKAEARAASRLDHPNICAVYDLGETASGQLYLAMPFYRGRTVSGMLDDGPLPIEQAVDIVRQSALGLERAHESGVIHRDIKPGNLLVTHEGEVKILDFGVAKLAGMSLSEPGMRVGTLSYMAPEQALGEAVTPSTDLWSLGVTLYEMISGRRPFHGEYEPALMYEILHGEPAPLRRLRAEAPEPLERAVRKLLAKAQTDRYQSARELLIDLEAWDESGDVVLRDDVPHNLPAPMSSFLGRAEDMRRIERLLETRRLLTLTGPGGVGKTRLAVETARRVLGRFPDGVWFVPLETVTNAATVPAFIAASLGVYPNPPEEALEAIRDRFRGAQSLLVLDNFEQVAAAAPEVARLLGDCPGIRILAVSRAPLRISGEQELVVPPLVGPAPGAGLAEAASNPSIALFLERARAARPDFELTEANLAAVTEVCTRLDGLPLAIELAAFRMKLFSPQALLTRLDRGLDLLAGGARDAPERLQTLRKAIQWSYNLLDIGAQRTLRHLAVFLPGGSLDAVSAVAELDEISAADALEILASHHLIRSRESADPQPRFEVSEPIRRFALEELRQRSEEAGARRRHANWYLALAERVAELLTGSQQVDWLDRLEADHANFGAAIDWAVEHGEAGLALRLGGSLWRVWVARARVREGWERFEAILALSQAGVEAAVIARGLYGYASLAHNLGHNEAAKQALEKVIAIFEELGDERGLAQALTNRAWVSCELSELAEAERLSHSALALHERLGDKRGAALAWNNLAWSANYRGDYPSAKRAIQKSLELRRVCGDRRGEGFALTCLAWSEQWHGDSNRAHRLLDEASRILLPIGDPILLGWMLTVRALTLLDQGKLEETCEIIEKGSREWRRGANRSGEAWVLTILGRVRLYQSRLLEADEQFAEAVRIWREIGSRWGLAMALDERALALRRRGQVDEAKRALGESIAIHQEIGDRRGLAGALETAAEIAGGGLLSGKLLAAAGRIRLEIGAPVSAHEERRRRESGLSPSADGAPESDAISAVFRLTTL